MAGLDGYTSTDYDRAMNGVDFRIPEARGFTPIFDKAGNLIPSQSKQLNINQNVMSNPTAKPTSWMGKGGYVDTASQGVQALSGLANAYMGYQNYQLAKDQFDLEKDSANRNIFNQGTLINADMDRRARVAAAMGGLAGADKDAYLADRKAENVNTSSL